MRQNDGVVCGRQTTPAINTNSFSFGKHFPATLSTVLGGI